MRYLRFARVLLISALIVTVIAVPSDVQACGCQSWQVRSPLGICEPPPPQPDLATCDISVGATVVADCGGDAQVPLQFTLTNQSFVPGTIFDWTLDPSGSPGIGGGSDGVVGFCDPGPGGCTTTYVPGSAGSAALDPVGETMPTLPSTFAGSATMIVDCSGNLGVATTTLIVSVAGTPVCTREVGACLLVRPCASPALSLPTVSIDDATLTVDNGTPFLLRFRVDRNDFPLARTPLVATLDYENSADPLEVLGAIPQSFLVDFPGGADSQTLTIECRSHGACFAGIQNDLFLSLRANDGAALSSVGFPGKHRVASVVVDEVKLGTSDVASVADDDADGQLEIGEDATLKVRIHARNRSLYDTFEDVTIETTFLRGFRIVDVEVLLAEYLFDTVDPPLSARQVSANISVSPARRGRQRLVIDGFDIVPRDANTDIIEDTVEAVVTVAADGSRTFRQCGPAEVTADGRVSGTYGTTVVSELLQPTTVFVSPRPPRGPSSATSAPASCIRPSPIPSSFVDRIDELSKPAIGDGARVRAARGDW